MTDQEKAIYIKIRAEQIQRSQNQKNGHLMTKPYPIEDAIKIATKQLNYDLQDGNMRITLEELLLENDETCERIIQNRSKEFLKIINNINDLE